MAGISDTIAQGAVNFMTGRSSFPALTSVFIALMTVMPTGNSGSGGTEVSGNNYSRVQIAGALAAGASFTTASTTLTLGATAPAWLLALGTNGSGVNVFDATTGTQVGTVASISGTTVTLASASAINSSGSTDSLVFSAFPGATASSGTEPNVTPASVTNGAAITFAVPTSTGWGTVLGFALYSAITAGTYYGGDYLGNYPWLPTTISAASPAVVTSKAHGYSAADTVVYTTKLGGVIPTFSQSNLTGTLAVVSPTTDTFTVTNGGTAVNTSASGDGQTRKVAAQSIPANVTTIFPASSLTLSVA